ncbi:MAG: hypothetical protein QGI68_06510 [Pseudomonadales bacterium]|jgi:hypothetical protein|nr:hypothetical protein [Pseudomonadales bacterium]MDP7595205.1 hypothetical protein [Pseudomonadales bacterium]HJN53136.1 hypothetical protein [Pseudomonadales bacterium]
MTKDTQIHEVEDDLLAAIDYCYEQGWTDGLPVVPPEASRVDSMLSLEGRPPETVLASHPATGLDCTIHAAAVNAVMAGCLPEYFPIIVAAFEAMNEQPFNFHGSTASTGGSAPLLIVSGPIVDEIGMNSGVNLFGPGNRANATIGRAVRLILLNVFKMVPGISDKSTQGHPGKYSFCIGERCDKNPWPALCEELGYPDGVSSVTVYAGSGFVNVENHGGNTPQAILTTVADAMANYGCISAGQSVVVLSPEHADIVAGTGWSKAQVQQYLYEHANRPIDGMQQIGKFREEEHGRGARAPPASHQVHRGLNSEDILVTVGGGDAGGHSAFIPSWSRSRGSIMQSKPIGVCLDCD